MVRCACEPSKSFGPAKILRSRPSFSVSFYGKKKDIANGSLLKRVDLPDPFSPTKKVTGEENSILGVLHKTSRLKG